MELVEREKCYSCGACIEICPKNAITTEWKDGFRYPSVNQSLCVNCGLCKRACPAEYKERKSQILQLYAFKHREQTVIEKSSSGGAFTALSNQILSEGGLVSSALLSTVVMFLPLNAKVSESLTFERTVHPENMSLIVVAALVSKEERSSSVRLLQL